MAESTDCDKKVQAASMVSNMWKSVALVLVGVCGTGAISWATYVRTAVTRDDIRQDLPAAIAQYSPYTTDAASLKEQLSELKSQNVTLQDQVQKLQVNVARISERLGVGKDSR